MSAPTKLPVKSAPPKRFYKHAAVVEIEGGYGVALDGKPIRTPKRHLLAVQSNALAEAIAAEWEAQGEHILLPAMRFNQFTCAALDYVAAFREDTLEETLGYAGTDLLCYQAEEPPALVEMQQEWNKWLQWLRMRYAVGLEVTKGLMPVTQPAETLVVLRAELEKMPLFPLTACWMLTKHYGSLVLALAVMEQALEAAQAFRISRIDEEYQNQQWGEDTEARERREAIALEISSLAKFLMLVGIEK